MSDNHLTHDTATPVLDVTTDDDGTIDWDEQTVVRLDNGPWVDYFETDTFYRFEITTARSDVDYAYQLDGEWYTARKPPEELRKSRWQLDNAPFVISHPDLGIVTNDTTIYGFTRQPSFDDEGGKQTAVLYVPTTDEDARTFLDYHRGISPGYFDEYDWDTDEESVDFYQRNLTYDHVAGVVEGRCSTEEGCGVDLDGTTTTRGDGCPCPVNHEITDDAGDERIVSTTDTVSPAEADSCSSGPCNCGKHVDPTVDQPDGIYTADGEWFAVGPDEHTKDSTEYADDAMFPVGSCESVDEAWQLRGHTSNLTIDDSTLEARIRRAGEAQDCDGPWSDNPSNDTTQDMTDSPNGTDSTSDSDDDSGSPVIDVGDLTVDAIAAQNDDVADLMERVEDLKAERDAAQTEVERLEGAVLDSKREEYEAIVDELTDLTDHWSEDELLDEFDTDADGFDVDAADDLIDDVEDKHEAVKAALDDIDSDAVADDGGTDGGDDESPTTMGTSEATGDSTEDQMEQDGPTFMPETASSSR